MSNKRQFLDNLLLIIVLIIGLVSLSLSSFSQEYYCGFDLLEQPRDGTEYVIDYKRQDDSTLLVVPVVFHVIHKASDTLGQGTNIFDEQLISAVDNWNSRMFTNVPGDPRVRLCIAEVDPNGNITSGITRHTVTAAYEQDGISISGGPGEPDANVKIPIMWDKQDYYNIYIVSEINGNDGGFGIQGYAYYPTFSPIDGTVLLYNVTGHDPDGSLGFNLKPTHDMGTTFIHELGHGLGRLPHIHEGGCTVETDCTTQGDGLCDTPPQSVWTTCLGPEPCNDHYPLNYMGYQPQDCRTEFSADGNTQMRNVLMNNPNRASLLNSNVCDFEEYEPPVEEPLCDVPCPNDHCGDAVSLSSCEPIEFCITNCTDDDYDILPHPTGNSVCGGTTLFNGRWYTFTPTETGVHNINVDPIPPGFLSNHPSSSGTYGDYEGIKLSMLVDSSANQTGGCNTLESIFSSVCTNTPCKWFCYSPVWAGNYDDIPCGDDAIPLVPYWADDPYDCPYMNGNVYDPTVQQLDGYMTLQAGVTYYIILHGFAASWDNALYPTGGAGTISICPQNPLPVELTEFKVTKQPYADLISWTTASETNNDYFQIEVSQDAINWNKVETTLGQGNSSVPAEYSYNNRNTLTGTYYYRLIQVDFDGTKKVYSPKAVHRENSSRKLTYYDVMGRLITTNYSELELFKPYIARDQQGNVEKIIRVE